MLPAGSTYVALLTTDGASHAVTSLALSHNATYLGVGHASGHIFLYDVQDARVPVRHVVPVHAVDVAAGKSEGHLVHTAITHLAFVGRRKTAIVSADQRGFCFFHSLGRVLGMASNDTVRVYGSYTARPAGETVLDLAALPPGTAPHAADAARFLALLLHGRLLLIGLQPKARTWSRITASAEDAASGALAWFPSTATDGNDPVLAFALGRQLHLLHLPASGAGVVPRHERLASAPHPVLRIQWVHHQLLLLITTDTWTLYDRGLERYTEWQPPDPLLAPIGPPDKTPWQQQACVWHSKAFFLAYGDVYAGDFLAWDTAVKEFVRANEYGAAIELCLEFYQGRGLGSGLGLPTDRAAREQVLAARLDTLQRAMATSVWAHPTSKAAAALARQCAAVASTTHDDTLLFGELYRAFEAHGYETVFVHEMEPFILHGDLPTPPPSVMQRLLRFRAGTHEYDRIAQLVLHVDPLHLDLDQTIPLCQKHHLWTPLAYLYTHALGDFTTPLEAMLAEATSDAPSDAHTVYSYLATVLRGKAFPEGTPLADTIAHKAVVDVSALLYAHDNANANVRVLLQLDPRAFLAVLDETFEGKWYGATPGDLPTRQDAVDALLAVRPTLPPPADAYVAVFVAQSVAKYLQFLTLTADVAHTLLAVLVRPASTPPLEAREFALECLCSVFPFDFTPDIIATLEHAQFWRVYEYALRKKQRYTDLLRLYLLGQGESAQFTPPMYDRVSSLLLRHVLTRDIYAETMIDALGDVALSRLGDVALLMARFSPESHDRALAMLPDAGRQRAYLAPFFTREAGTDVPAPLRRAWIACLAEDASAELVEALRAKPPTYFEPAYVLDVARAHAIYDAVLWALAQLGRLDEALDTLDTHVAEVHVALAVGDAEGTAERVDAALAALTRTVRMGTSLAVAHARTHAGAAARMPWYRVLRALLGFLHTGSRHTAARAMGQSLLQEALAALLTSVPSETVSFPDLFRQLISTSEMDAVPYKDVRMVLAGMLSAYELRCDMLTLGVRLNESDATRLFHELVQARTQGWYVGGALQCGGCHKRLRSSDTAVVRLTRHAPPFHRACWLSDPRPK